MFRMGSSRNLAGTIVQRGALEKATLVPSRKPASVVLRLEGRTLFRSGLAIFSPTAGIRALARHGPAAYHCRHKETL
jgi:hypothetical protein